MIYIMLGNMSAATGPTVNKMAFTDGGGKRFANVKVCPRSHLSVFVLLFPPF